MNIGGFVRNSLIDFPETVACIVFTQGCNFLCPYCHNPGLVPGKAENTTRDADLETVMAFLEQRKGLVDGVVITGGEPTLQHGLPGFCRTVKSMGYRVKLDSNGSRPKIIAALLDEGLIDYVAMDIKTDLDHYPQLTAKGFVASRIEESIHLIMDQAPAYEFRTTCSRPFVSAGILDNIGRLVAGASKYVLANCSRKVAVLNPEFVKSDDHFFSNAQIRALGAVIEPYVEQTVIR